MTIKVTNWHKGRDHHQDGHHYVHGQQGLFKVAASLPSLSKWYIQFPFTINFVFKSFLQNQAKSDLFILLIFKTMLDLHSNSHFQPRVAAIIFHFPNDVLNFHSHLFIFSRFSLKPGQSWYFPPVHFKSNNLFAFKFASLVHSYSYLVKSSLSKIIFSKSTVNLETVSFQTMVPSFQTISFSLFVLF